MRDQFDFQVSVETDDQTGRVIAVYLRVREGKCHRTKEYSDGIVFADYDKRGKLLGIEILGRCRATVLNQIATLPSEKQFVRNSVPRGMLVGAR